jgi:hypothetical protein
MRLRCYQIEDARRSLATAITAHGAEHPAARAALGRWWFYLGRVPQAGLASIEAVAWARESGGELRPRWNRSQRRHAAQKMASVDHNDLCDSPTILMPFPVNGLAHAAQ